MNQISCIHHRNLELPIWEKKSTEQTPKDNPIHDCPVSSPSIRESSNEAASLIKNQFHRLYIQTNIIQLTVAATKSSIFLSRFKAVCILILFFFLFDIVVIRLLSSHLFRRLTYFHLIISLFRLRGKIRVSKTHLLRVL